MEPAHSHSRPEEWLCLAPTCGWTRPKLMKLWILHLPQDRRVRPGPLRHYSGSYPWVGSADWGRNHQIWKATRYPHGGCHWWHLQRRPRLQATHGLWGLFFRWALINSSDSELKHAPGNAEACRAARLYCGLMVWVDEGDWQVSSSQSRFHWDMNLDHWIQSPQC